MANRDGERMTHKIMQDGIKPIRGDALSVGVIFGNLTGRNADDWNAPHRQKGDYEAYMAHMEQALGVRIDPQKLAMAEV